MINNLRISCFIFFILFLCLFAQYSIADSLPQDFIFQNQQNQWQNIEKEKEILNLQREIANSDSIEKEKSKDSKDNKLCFNIDKIDVKGVTYLKESLIDDITKKNEHKCLNINKINSISEEINNLYIENSYVGTHVFLPEQNVRNGTLKIQVKEGFIEDINLEDKHAMIQSSILNNVTLFFAVPIEFILAKFGKKPKLSLNTIEDIVYVFNKLQTNRSVVNLEPGKDIGGTILSIKNNPQPLGLFKLIPHNGLLRHTVITGNIDNSGLNAIGAWRQNYNFSQDNLLGINDNLTVYYSGALPTDNGNSSHIVNVAYSVPFGRWNFTASNIYSSYSSEISGLNKTFPINGQNNIASGRIERLMFYGKGYRVNLFTKLNVWAVNNYFQNILITTSSRNSTTFETGLNGMYVFLGNKSIYFNTFWAIGTNLFGATNTQNVGDSLPNNQFNKIKGNITINLPFDILNQSFGVTSVIGFQYGFNTLYSQEQLAIGDRYSVRGFQNSYLISDSGVYLKNDFVYTIPSFKSEHNDLMRKILKNLITGMQVFVGFDYGFIANYSSLNNIVGQNTGQIAGFAVGSRWKTQFTNIEVAIAKAVIHPSNLIVDNFQIYVSVGLIF